MHKVPKATLEYKTKGRTRAKMSKADKDFVRGYACCLSNAIRTESWRPTDIGGGIDRTSMITAGVPIEDVNLIVKESK